MIVVYYKKVLLKCYNEKMDTTITTKYFTIIYTVYRYGETADAKTLYFQEDSIRDSYFEKLKQKYNTESNFEIENDTMFSHYDGVKYCFEYAKSTFELMVIVKEPERILF